MEDVLLTNDEIEECKELFEYEMTQVILNLRDKYAADEKIPSPVEHLDITEEDVNKHLDFAPLPGVKAEKRPQDVPLVNFDISYIPMSEVSVDNDNHAVPNSMVNIDFMPFKDIKVTTEMQGCPDNVIVTPYTPYVSLYEAEAADVPSSCVSLEYMSVLPGTAEAFSQDMPMVNINPVYTPIVPVPELSEDAAQDISVVNVNVVYAPIIPAAIEGSVASFPIIEKPPAFTPVVPEIDTSIKIEIPKSAANMKYKQHKKKLKVKKIVCPDVHVSSEFNPIDALSINRIDVDVPVKTGVLEYHPLNEPIETLPYINAPKINIGFEFSPMSGVSIDNTTDPVPMQRVNIEYINEIELNPPSLNPEDLFPLETIMPKDYYSMWLNA
jgi:hypothetical protein